MIVRWIPCAILAMASALLLSQPWASSQTAPGPLKIGVVDLRLLMDNSQLRKDKEAEINRIKDAEAAKLKEERKRLDGLKSEIDLMAKDNPQLPAKNKEYARQQEALMLKNRWAEADVLETWDKTFLEVYSEILRLIEEYRDKNGYDLILRFDSQPLGAGAGRVIDQLDRKIVMARSSAVDITEPLTKYVNDAYEQQQKKK